MRTLQLDIFRDSKNFSDDFHFGKFELRNDQLYYKENDRKPLMTQKGELRPVKELVKILGIKGFTIWVTMYLRANPLGIS